MRCAKCNGEMEKGLIMPQPAFGFGWQRKIAMTLIWGKNVKRYLWSGLSYEYGGKVETHKCKKCGYLESYAV